MNLERIALVLAAVLVAVPAFAQPASPAAGPLREIRFVSDAPIDEDGLRNLIALGPGMPVSERTLPEVRRLLELTEIFRTIHLRLLSENDGVVLLVELSRKPVIVDVRVTGLQEMTSKQAGRIIRIDKGTIYEPALVDAAQVRLLERYRRLAYVDAQVQVTVEPRDGDVALKFDIEEGRPKTIAAVIPEGDVTAWDASLWKRAKRIEGGRYTQDAVRNTERKLVRELRGKGYYEARLKWTWEPLLTGDRGLLHLQIESGPRFVIETVGNQAKKRKKLLRLIDLETRLIITDGTWRELASRMREEYQRAGYYKASVTVDIVDADPKLVTFHIDEGRRYAVTRVIFEGNRKLSDAELRKVMETAPHHWVPWPRTGRLVSTVLNEDMKRLRRLYHTRGFASSTVRRTRRRVDDEQGTIEIVIPIREGPQTIVSEQRDVGIPKTVDLAARRLRVGAPLDPDAVEADQHLIQRAVQHEGYAEPHIDTSIEREEERAGVIDAHVVWNVDPGQRQRIGRLIVQRNVDTRAEPILRELPFHEGDPLSADRLLEGQVDVYRLGLFRSVSIVPITPPGEPVRDLAVNVTEQPAGTLGFGGGYNTRDGIKGFVEVGYNNVGGMARRLSLRGEASLDPDNFKPDQYLGNLGFIEPRLLDSVWRYKVNLIGERSTQNVDKFSLERFAFAQSLDRKLWKRLQGGVQFEVEQSRVFDVRQNVAVIPEDTGQLRTVTFSPFLAFDGRDDPFLPTRGMYDSISLRYAVPVLSNVHFGKLATQHAQHVPLSRDLTFVYSARLGAGRVFDGAPFLPIRERFFLGGRTTVRGFAENSIGPTVGTDGHRELGGDLSVNLNTELLYGLPFGFQLAAFLDGGGLFLVQCDASCRARYDIHDAEISLHNFRRSAGLGLRFKTPVGPIALDYGFKLDKRESESLGHLHFNVGTTF